MVSTLPRLPSLLLQTFALTMAMAVAAPSLALADPHSPTLEELLALPELGNHRNGLAVSPNGRYAAVFRRAMLLDEDRLQYDLMVVPTTGEAEARVVGDGGGLILHQADGRFSGAPVNRAPAWSPDSEWIAYLARRGGAVELWVSSRDGRVRRSVARPPGDVTRFAWLPDNSGLVLETSTPRASLARRRAEAEARGFLVDDRFEPYFSLRPHPAVNAERQVFVARVRSQRVDEASTQERAVLDARPATEPPAAVAAVVDAGRRAWIAPMDAASQAYAPPLGVFAETTDGSSRRCAHAPCSGRMTALWWRGEEVIFQRNEGHAEVEIALYAWRPADDAIRLVRRAEELLIDCARDAGDRLICLQESAVQPRRVVSIDLGTGALRTLYDPNPRWGEFALPRVERIDVHDRFDNEAYAHLVYPMDFNTERRYPLVIVQYRSRGFLRAGTGGEYPILALSARGYFVLSVDRPEPRALNARFRAQDVQRQAELDNSENEMKQSALEALLAIVSERGRVDPARIGITGMSDGAETVYWALGRSRAFAAAVVSTPPTDVTAWTQGSQRTRDALRGGDGLPSPWSDPSSPWGQWWERNETVRHAADIWTPLLMNLSEAEALMGFPLHTRLREFGRPVEAYIYPGQYHVKWRPQHVLAAQRRALDWLDFWLRDVEQEDTLDPGRIERWRAMRERSSALTAR